MASYTVNKAAVSFVRELIDKKRYVLDSDWGEVQPSADDQNATSTSTRGTSMRRGTSG